MNAGSKHPQSWNIYCSPKYKIVVSYYEEMQVDAITLDIIFDTDTQAMNEDRAIDEHWNLVKDLEDQKLSNAERKEKIEAAKGESWFVGGADWDSKVKILDSDGRVRIIDTPWTARTAELNEISVRVVDSMDEDTPSSSGNPVINLPSRAIVSVDPSGHFSCTISNGIEAEFDIGGLEPKYSSTYQRRKRGGAP